MKRKMCPTPTTLDQAIDNGIQDYIEGLESNYDVLKENVYLAVKDYIAQKFTVAYIKADKKPYDQKGMEEFYKKLVLEK